MSELHAFWTEEDFIFAGEEVKRIVEKEQHEACVVMQRLSGKCSLGHNLRLEVCCRGWRDGCDRCGYLQFATELVVGFTGTHSAVVCVGRSACAGHANRSRL